MKNINQEIKLREVACEKFREYGIDEKVKEELKRIQGAGLLPDSEIIYAVTFATMMVVLTELFVENVLVLKKKQD